MLERASHPPDVSVIVPNRDSLLIDATLRSILAQTMLDRVLEIFVVGTDQPGRVFEHDLVHFIRTEKPVTAPVARNIGIQAATGSYLAFIDADCIAAPDWLEQLLAAQQDGHPIVGGGISLENDNFRQLCYNLTMLHDFLTTAPPGERQNLGTLNLCVHRPVVEQIGVFNEHLVRSQDTEWTLRMRRAGYKLYFAPSAIVRHFPHVPSLKHILRVWYTTGSFSTRIRHQYQDVIAAPPFSRHPGLQVALAPFVSFVVASQIFLRSPRLWRYVYAWPVIYATKLAWCLGAASEAHSLSEPWG